MFLAERDNVEISSVAILHKQEEGMYMRGEYTVDGEEKPFSLYKNLENGILLLPIF